MELNPRNMPMDPMVYIARVEATDPDGKPRIMRIIYDDDPPFEVHDGDAFFTIRTEVLLENPQP